MEGVHRGGQGKMTGNREGNRELGKVGGQGK